ncbi:hypothetical protein BCUN_0528 [Bifidobacterium cuniculi]|uniref:Uncharacterized protein n=2 Tax=Bifidobacterium cuniculi TaxID=1688 RepID=A0A087B4S8_9BIFI|nr:hypothetical protein BCUN_0528 [Bifidobacterium cuniculi]
MPQGKQWRNELLQLVDLYYPGVDTTNFTGFLTLLERWHVHGEAGMLFHTRAPHTLTPMRTIELADTLGGARLHTDYYLPAKRLNAHSHMQLPTALTAMLMLIQDHTSHNPHMVDMFWQPFPYSTPHTRSMWLMAPTQSPTAWLYTQLHRDQARIPRTVAQWAITSAWNHTSRHTPPSPRPTTLSADTMPTTT